MVRILLVDDQLHNLVALEALLASPSRELVSVQSGEAAVRAFRARAFALVVLDVMMPGMTGVQTASALRELAPELPILFVTALADDPEIQRAAAELGICWCHGKPIDMYLLRTFVESIESGKPIDSGQQIGR